MIPWQRLQSDEQHDPLSLFDDPFDDLDDEIEEIQESSEEDESPESRNDLIHIQENSSLSSSLLRHWHYSDFVRCLALWGVKHQSKLAIELADDKTPTRLFWLTGEGIPLESWSKIRRAHFIKDFFDSSRFMIGIEATVLAGLLLHDLISFGVFPEERCGVASLDILDGTANNQITWTNHFGSDVIHEFAYWVWSGTVLIPPMVGLIAAFFQNSRRELVRSLEADDVINKVDSALNVLDKESLTFKDACVSMIPFTAFSKTLAQVKFMLLWDGRRNTDQSLLISLHLKNALIGNLIELTHSSSYFFIRYQAFRLLAEIAASFHPKNLDRFIEDPVHKAGLSELRDTILKALREEPMSEARTNRAIIDIETMCEPSTRN